MVSQRPVPLNGMGLIAIHEPRSDQSQPLFLFEAGGLRDRVKGTRPGLIVATSAAKQSARVDLLAISVEAIKQQEYSRRLPSFILARHVSLTFISYHLITQNIIK
jgi:hypothetical protein